ncbi:Predicted N-acyltransferase, GNAT family [Micrococcales bacterium KH10]|nr:Predicted N-acyltransferase, GNAT family [Micrococcales bacterium KH10]
MVTVTGSSFQPPSNVRIIPADTDRLRSACQAVRWEVFVIEQQVPFALEIDARDFLDSTVHLAAVDEDDQVVGTVRVLRDSPEQFHLGRLAVLPAARGHGAGSALVTAVHDAVAALLPTAATAVIIAEAQVQAAAMYTKLGYEAVSLQTFMEAGIEHQTMSVTVTGVRQSEQ